MRCKNAVRHIFLIIAILSASHVHAATTDYVLKNNTWELISVPNPIPFAINTPMKLFGAQIASQLPLAEYGMMGDWVMFSYSSEIGNYEVTGKESVFEPGKGYWAIQAASTDDITVQVVTRYNIGATGPGGGVVFQVDATGTGGLEAAPEDQSADAVWCSAYIDIIGVSNHRDVRVLDSNSGTQNTPRIIAECGATSAAGLAADYVWPNGVADGFLPNKDEMNILFDLRNVVGGFTGGVYWTSSEFSSDGGWYQRFSDGFRFGLIKDVNSRVRAVRRF